ncbi:MAG: helix-turn-helix transcriptional regulator [Clostridia bacterium]|nr:helix-turn-helix transcriptional regulator [Clostridia bacterium]
MKIYKTSGVYLHWHEEYEFIMVENGAALCIINGESVNLNKNTAILVQSGVLHSIHARPNTNITAIVVSPALWADRAFGELFNGQISFQYIFDNNEPTDRSVIEILKHIVNIYERECFGYEFILKAKFAELFAILIENERICHTPKQSRKTPAELKTMMDYIHEHYAGKITLKTLSALSFYSQTYIIKLFKKFTNFTPAEYITQYRLTHAQRKLKNGLESNLDIALSCGFNSESYFVYAFKKRYGITPHTYRIQESHKG